MTGALERGGGQVLRGLGGALERGYGGGALRGGGEEAVYCTSVLLRKETFHVKRVRLDGDLAVGGGIAGRIAGRGGGGELGD